MVTFHVEAADFCSSSELISSSLVHNITKEKHKVETCELKKSGTCMPMAHTSSSNAFINNLYSYIVITNWDSWAAAFDYKMIDRGRIIGIGNRRLFYPMYQHLQRTQLAPKLIRTEEGVHSPTVKRGRGVKLA